MLYVGVESGVLRTVDFSGIISCFTLYPGKRLWDGARESMSHAPHYAVSAMVHAVFTLTQAEEERVYVGSL
jgi:hypothetical protein